MKFSIFPETKIWKLKPYEKLKLAAHIVSCQEKLKIENSQNILS